MSPRRSLLALAFAALSPAAHAIDLWQAWQGAQQHAPEAWAARAARQAGEAQGEQARALWRPNVVVEGGVSYATGDTAVRGARFSAPGFGTSTGVAFDTSVSGGTATRYAASLRQPLVDRELSAHSQALQIASQSSEAAWARSRQELALQTARAYFDAALAAEKLRLLRSQQQAVDRAAVEAEDRFKAGDRPVTDVHEAAARAAALQAERLAAETQAQVAASALADLTGLPPAGDGLALPGGAASAGDPGSLDDWLARSAVSNLDLRLAESAVQSAAARASASAGALSPSVQAVAQVSRDRLSGDGDFGTASSTARNGAIGVQVSIPLFTGGLRTARQAEGQALVEQARASQQAARQQVAQQVRSAWLDLSAGRARIAALEAALKASRSRLDATRVGLQAGDRTTLDLLNAENDASAAELALLEARAALLVRRLQLAALAGELEDSTVRQANAQLVPKRQEP